MKSNTADPVTLPLETSCGRVRGLRAGGLSRFFGIPYGTDTGTNRFRPAVSPPSWSGVRDCFSLGAKAPQGPVSLPGLPGVADGPGLSVTEAIMRVVASDAVESEDCLFLNVHTPDSSSARLRPVMVWLHGGAFAVGSGFDPMTDPSLLALHGDVVVVSLNHRLNALGYLYLGALHDDFADSGNCGHLDIVLALQWVRDNIVAFGGDPGNVTIFGESGGGAKVGALLGMRPARGLFHKAIEQSGPAARLVDRSDAAMIAELTLRALGIAKTDVHKLQTLDWQTVVAAASGVRLASGAPGLTERTLAPCVDGRSIPAHPFSPLATDLSSEVPLMIGTTRDEWTQMLSLDKRFGNMAADDARRFFTTYLGDAATDAYEFYRASLPSDDPSYWVSAFLTDLVMRTGSIVTADRKAAQNKAPVFMYRVDFEPDVMNRMLRSTHSIDVPLVFGNLQPPELIGTGPVVDELSRAMMQAWINFARTGDPSSGDLAWPHYDPAERLTMVFDAVSEVRPDPDRAARLFWEAKNVELVQGHA